MLLPALVERELYDVARAHHDEHPEGPAVERIVDWIGAFIPRVMFPASLAAAAREAGAEPLWTGRPRPYAESTLRLAATRLDARGAWVHVADAVWKQVTTAVAMVDDEIVAYTDMFDQPYFTKKFAHAAPIGRLGNRLLAGTYFGMTTVALPGGPTLFAHLSWHKPASPLRDALEDLFEDDTRMAWWHAHVRLHILDRGANGDAVLQWLWNWEVPYLTIGRKSADLWRFHTPTARNAQGLPFVVRPDARLDGDADEGPWEVIVPARPDDAAGDARAAVSRGGSARRGGAAGAQRAVQVALAVDGERAQGVAVQGLRPQPLAPPGAHRESRHRRRDRASARAGGGAVRDARRAGRGARFAADAAAREREIGRAHV